MCVPPRLVAGRVFPSNFKWLVGQTDCLPCSGAAAAAAHVPLIRMNRSRAQWEDYKKTTQHRIKSIGPLLLPLFFEWNPVRRQQTRQTAGRSDHYYKTIYSHTHLCSHRSKVMATEEGTNERSAGWGSRRRRRRVSLFSCLGPLLFQVVLLWLNNRFICGTLGGRAGQWIDRWMDG